MINMKQTLVDDYPLCCFLHKARIINQFVKFIHFPLSSTLTNDFMSLSNTLIRDFEFRFTKIRGYWCVETLKH